MADIIQITPKEVASEVPRTITDTILFYLGEYWWVGLIIVVLLAIIFYVIYRIVEGIKEANDPIYYLFNERKHLCKQHRDLTRYRSFFKSKKNNPIIAQYMEHDKIVRKIIGYYYGDYYSNEGNKNIAFFQRGRKKWFFIPVIRILLLNKKPIIKLRIDKKEGRKRTEEEITQHLPTNIEHFTNGEIILIGCKSIDKIDPDGLFYVPILAEKDGSQLDFSSYAYKQLTDIIKGEQLITNLNYFVQANKKALEINPMLRTTKQVGDSSSSVEERDEN